VPDLAHPEDPSRQLRELVASGRYQDALDLHRRETDQNVRQRPEVQLLAATAATRLGELRLGVTLAETALGRFQSRADNDGRMRSTNLIGAIAFEHGRLAEAERAFGEALRLARELNDSLTAARASNNLASVALLRGNADLALSLYRSALLAYQRLGDRRGTAETYHNLGLTFRQLSEFPDADGAALQAVRHAEQLGEQALMALAVMGRAETHIERGETALARPELDRAERLAKQSGDEIGGAEVGRIRALLAIREGDFQSAVTHAETARSIASHFASALLQGECAALAARALQRLGRMAESEERRGEAVRIFEALGATRFLERLESSLSS
jgi:tetratricopeptide (TPR) repeat protein